MVAIKESFFFQAEDGIRDLTVTGVQTCALPIFSCARIADEHRAAAERRHVHRHVMARHVAFVLAEEHDLARSEEHTSELQSQSNLVCRLLLDKRNVSTVRLLVATPYPPAATSAC